MELTELRNLKHMLDYAAEKFGDTDFLQYKVSGGIESRTYSQLKACCDAFSRMLEKRGFNNAHVAVIGPTSFNWIVTYFGTADAGSVIIPLAPAETVDMNCRLMEFADTDIFVFDKAHKNLYEQAKKALPGIKLFISVDDTAESADVLNFSDLLSEYRGEYTKEPQPDSLCALVFTSGTTGFPKGVMLTHKNLVYSAASVHVACPTKKMFCCLPIHHSFCFTANITKSICRGKTVCVNDNLANVIQDLRLYKPDSIVAVPQLVTKIMGAAIKYAASKPETEEKEAVLEFLGGNIMDVISGGAPLDAAVNERFNKTGILVLNGYGMTECSPIIANNAIGCFRHGSVGKPIPCMEVKIQDGEILVKGPSVMSGYYKNPQATAEAFTEDGFLHTGDLGHFDEDGYLYVTGRCKNLILLDNGENVSAEMLEERFAEEPLVQEVVCFGDKGAIYAEIFPNKAYMSENNIGDIDKEMPGLLMRVNSSLAHFQKISGYIVREIPFERTSSSKIKRGVHGLVKKAAAIMPETAAEKRVYEAVKDLLMLSEVSMSDNFFAIGGDSLSAVELALTLNIKPQAVYDKPFLSALAGELDEKEQAESGAAADVNELIAQSSTGEILEKEYSCALLTGATGFLGIHILKELADSGLRVYCLVRNPEKLLAQAEYYFGGFSSENIIPLRGNIEKEALGLSENTYEKLKNEVETVFHVAANVHHAGDYSELERTNVNGTENIIDFCFAAGAVLQHTSTVSLHGAATVRQSFKNAVFNEQVLDIGQHYCDNVYIHSKYKAEEAVLLARKRGLKANIYRIGNLTWRASDGKFQKNEDDNGFLRRIHAILKLGLYHDNMDKYPMDLTAVDECAKAYTALALSRRVNEIYHMYNQNFLDSRDMFNYLGIPYRHVSGNEMIETAFANTDDRDIHVYLFYMIISGRSANVAMDNSFTLSRLEQCGFSWSKPDRRYLMLSGENEKSRCLDFEKIQLKPMRNTGGVLNPIQKLSLGVLKNSEIKESKILKGENSLFDLAAEIKALAVRKPLLITLRHFDKIAQIRAFLDMLDMQLPVFNSYDGEPTVSDSDRALKAYIDKGCDGIIAIGGGSVLDIAKITALRAANPDSCIDDICKLDSNAAPCVAFFAAPTTAGTGSEATVYAVLTDESENKKRPFISGKFLPDAVALDFSLTTGLSSQTTAYAGIDALSHAVESFLSLFAPAFPEDAQKAPNACKTIFAYLKTACEQPDNAVAREQLLYASFEAGKAFRRIGTGYIHAIAHRLGEFYHAPHGLCIAAVFTAVLRAYLPCAADKMAVLARECGLSYGNTDDAADAMLFIEAIEKLINEIHIDKTLIGFDKKDIDEIVRKSQEEAKIVAYPRPFSDEQLKKIILSEFC